MTAARGQAGFSLIELLVVIAVLGALSGVATLATGAVLQHSREVTCRTERRTLLTALEAARADNLRDEYPPVAGPDGLDGLRSTGFLEWQPAPSYWVYAPVPGGQPGETTLARIDTATVTSTACGP